MGQQEVYSFLKKYKDKWFSTREISKKLGISLGSVTMSAKRLRESKLVRFKYENKPLNNSVRRKILVYKYKR